MLILSLQWLLIMIAVTACHWGLPPKARNWFLIAACAAFLAWLSPLSLGLLTALTGIYYALAARYNDITGNRLGLLLLITGGILSVFKLAVEVDMDLPYMDAIIPLGLSYYTFRLIHYAIEKYKGHIPAHSFQNFALYMFFLPTMIAGPIHRYHDFQKDIERKRWDSIRFILGLERLLFGYIKVVCVVNFFLALQFEAVIMTVEGLNPWLASYLVMLKMSLSVYFLFSGYSDIAIGFGMLLGFKVMENFNHPYKAINISDFWRRWHISLTSWCRDYVYMGVIAKYRSAILAALAAMLVMGLWHEFSLRYVLWGAYHGIGIAIWQQFQKIKPHLPRIDHEHAVKGWEYFSRALTLHYFMIGAVLVQHDTLAQGLHHIQEILLIK